MKRIMWLAIFGLLLGSATGYAVPYRGYLFNFWEDTVPAPQAYVPQTVLTGESLQVGKFSSPQDIFITDELIYVLDSGNTRILIFDHTWSLVSEIKDFINDTGSTDSFSNPRGLFVTGEGDIYVADRNNHRIIQFNSEGDFLKIIGQPEPQFEGVLPAGFRYQPGQVVVDVAGRIYVISEGTYDGILEFDDKGDFRGFIGAPRVTPSLVDWFWSRIATREQRQRRALFLPTEYSNIQIDERGFIYAAVSGVSTDERDAIRRLNPTGRDVLRRQGFHPPIGDVRYPWTDSGASIEGRSIFVDVVPRENGIYSALDRRRGRVFTYDANGSLLYVFGGRGERYGLLQGPTALGVLGDQLIILDGQTNRITIFQPTSYSQYIHQAIEYHNSGQYDQAAELWQEVLAHNANFAQAYTGIGRSLLRQDRFADAMEYFRLGNNRRDYSEALGLYRREVIAHNFDWIMTMLVGVVIAFYLLSRFRPYRGLFAQWNRYYGWNSDSRDQSAATKEDEVSSWRLRVRSTVRSLWYGVYVVAHPVDGFWDLKHEKRGNISAATIILGLVTLTYVLVRQYTGFALNERDLTKLNIFIELASLLIPFILWTSVNWSLTTLLEGKGSFKDIYIASAFALTPIVLINIPMTIVSNFITRDEAAFYYVITTFALIWSIGLLFIGNMTIHQFFTGKTLWSALLTLLGMLLVAFIGLLFFSLIGEMIGFVTSVYTEATFRL